MARNKEAASVTTTMLAADAPAISGGYSGHASAQASSSRTFQMYSPETVRPCFLVCRVPLHSSSRVRLRGDFRDLRVCDGSVSSSSCDSLFVRVCCVPCVCCVRAFVHVI